MERLRLTKYQINGKDIYLASKRTFLAAAGLNSRHAWDLETRGILPKSIFRRKSRGYNVVTKQVEDLYKQLYTQEHVILYVTFIESRRSPSGNISTPSVREAEVLYAEWKRIDDKYISEYKLDSESNVHIAKEILNERELSKRASNKRAES